MNGKMWSLVSCLVIFLLFAADYFFGGPDKIKTCVYFSTLALFNIWIEVIISRKDENT